MIEDLKFADSTIKDDDYISMLKETADSMNASIENIEKVVAQQNRLVEVISKAPESKEFEDFIKDLNDNCQQLQKQKVDLVAKQLNLALVLKDIEESINAKRAVINLMKAFSMFE